MKPSLVAVASLAVLASSRFSSVPPVQALPGDAVVVRVTSLGPEPVRFSGVIVSDDASAIRQINAATPYELRLTARDVSASFRTRDGGPLAGEIRTYRRGVLVTRAAGANRGGFELRSRNGGAGFAGM